MPGGRFQAPADQECLSCLEESLSRQNGSESRSERTCSHLEASESEEQRPHSTSGAKEVSRELRVSGLREGRKMGCAQAFPVCQGKVQSCVADVHTCCGIETL